MEGRPLGNSTTPETTGSGRAPGKRPWNGNQFGETKKTVLYQPLNVLFCKASSTKQ